MVLLISFVLIIKNSKTDTVKKCQTYSKVVSNTQEILDSTLNLLDNFFTEDKKDKKEKGEEEENEKKDEENAEKEESEENKEPEENAEKEETEEGGEGGEKEEADEETEETDENPVNFNKLFGTSSKKRGLFSGVCDSVTSGFSNSCYGVGLYYCTYLNKTDCSSFSTSNLIQSFYATVKAIFSLEEYFLKEFLEARLSARTIFDIIDNKTKISTENKASLDKTKLKLINSDAQSIQKKSIKFQSVSFKDSKKKNKINLTGFNLNIEAGTTVALVNLR